MRLAFALAAAAALSYAQTALPEDPRPSGEPSASSRDASKTPPAKDRKALPFDDGSRAPGKNQKALPFDDGSKTRVKRVTPKKMPFDDGSKARARPADDGVKTQPTGR